MSTANARFFQQHPPPIEQSIAMSSEQTTNDLRSIAQDNKRAAARKHKWQLGSVERVGRGPGNPRPFRPSETEYNIKRRETKGAVASLAHTAKMTRKHDMLEGNAVSDDSASSSSDHDEATPSPPADAGVMYSFDAAKGPTHGSQILNVALAKAVERFEEKETVKLVKNEYEVLDTEGESVGVTPVKKGKVKAAAEEEADEDYEFV
ncbi:uncharacterized protein LTR77_005490 [Saxophila tyrrhenica]|uniref:Uncharacterized protein n=1 Tax=Saxophila tyrrhenica TaxID=1690608 RepID=A0AAV9P8P7_9PEZI|nr:hypothetical protein LTR77_005490 [Saxophila tyrrhenica]